MEDGDIKLHESLAIMRYILERYGELCSHILPHCNSGQTDLKGSIAETSAA